MCPPVRVGVTAGAAESDTVVKLDNRFLGDVRSSATDDGDDMVGLDGAEEDLTDSADPNSGRRISAIEKQDDLL